MTHVSLTEVRPLTQNLASVKTGTRLRARIIEGDIWGTSGYYSRRVLERDGPVVFAEGTQVYLDHPTDTEAFERPGRSIRDLAGKIATTPVYESDGLYADFEIYPHVAPVIAAMAEDIGLSIRAGGNVEEGEVGGRRGRIVTKLTDGFSVDFVTRAAAGGQVVALLESARTELTERTFSAQQRRELADKGNALPDGGFPIVTREDLSNALQALGRASDKAAAKRHIIKRARALGAVAMLPDDWGVTEASTEDAMPVQPVSEARNIGQWLESRVHHDFAVLADEVTGEGQLTDEERTELLGAIIEAREVFTRRVQADASQLYERAVAEAGPAAGSADTPPPADAEPSGDTPPDETTPPTTPPPADDATTTTEEPAGTPDATTTSAEETAMPDTPGAGASAPTNPRQVMEAELAQVKRTAAIYAARDRARQVVTETLADAWLPPLAVSRITADLLEGDRLPLVNDELDEAALRDRATSARDTAEAEHAQSLQAQGFGRPRGLGDTAQPGGDRINLEERLKTSFAELGMTENAADLASKGR